jgi:hypothetical protein
MGRSASTGSEGPAASRRALGIPVPALLVAGLAALGPAGWLLLVERALWPYTAVYPSALAGVLAGGVVSWAGGLAGRAQAVALAIPPLLFSAAQFPVYALLFRRWRRRDRRQAVAGVVTLHLATALPWFAALAVGG